MGIKTESLNKILKKKNILYSFSFYASLYRVPQILTFQVAAKSTTNKLQTKENVMLEDHKVNIICNNFFE